MERCKWFSISRVVIIMIYDASSLHEIFTRVNFESGYVYISQIFQSCPIDTNIICFLNVGSDKITEFSQDNIYKNKYLHFVVRRTMNTICIHHFAPSANIFFLFFSFYVSRYSTYCLTSISNLPTLLSRRIK